MNNSLWMIGYWALGIFCGIGCVLQAKQKGRSEAWFFVGLLFNVVGLLLIAVASDLDEESRVRESLQELDDAYGHLQRRFFADATVLDPSAETPSLCTRCMAFREDQGFCRELGRNVWKFRVAQCRYFDPPGGPGNQPQDATDG